MGQVGLHLLLGVLFLLAFGAMGLALATDFRGATTWHARRSVGMFRQPTQERVSRQAALRALPPLGLALAVVALKIWNTMTAGGPEGRRPTRLANSPRR
jgi:hypothetical protein